MKSFRLLLGQWWIFAWFCCYQTWLHIEVFLAQLIFISQIYDSQCLLSCWSYYFIHVWPSILEDSWLTCSIVLFVGGYDANNNPIKLPCGISFWKVVVCSSKFSLYSLVIVYWLFWVGILLLNFICYDKYICIIYMLLNTIANWLFSAIHLNETVSYHWYKCLPMTI